MMLMSQIFFLDVDRSQSGLRFANYDVAVGAVNNCLQLRLLCGRHAELIERLVKIIHKRLPFFWRDGQGFVRFAHRAPRIFVWAGCSCVREIRAASAGYVSVGLWPSAGPADHFGNEIFETGWRHLVVSL